MYPNNCWLGPFPLFFRVAVLLLPSLSLADPLHEVDTANWLLQPLSSVDGFFPQPWRCSGTAPNPQSIREFHFNWHCTNRDHIPVNFGNRFFGFHKQFLQGYNSYLASVNEPRIQVWEPGPGVPIPPGHKGRARMTRCTNCLALETRFKAPPEGTLNTFTTLNALGNTIIDWHNNNHGNLERAGGSGSCRGTLPDIGCPEFSPVDPIFYPYHHIFDEIQDEWRTLQPTDVAIVLDRSGSMSLPGTRGGTRLDAAKSAASLFVDLLEDGAGHKVGMVSFSTTASNPPDMPLNNIASAPAEIAAALSRLVSSGQTSIGDGLLKAQNLITSGPEARKAILLLTDGEENQPPMISDVVSSLGDTHVCSVGLGTAMTLNGPKMQQLSERQGGIYISTPDDLELKKFFVLCFANIFDSFVGEDPLGMIAAGELVSAPTVHLAAGDEKVVFVLGWSNSSASGSLQLAITTPAGSVLDLTAPGVQSKVGPSWHIVRVKTPYYGEVDGEWTARAVRPVHSYVNGFSSRSFANFNDGVALIRAEISTLCNAPSSCRRILYYEDKGGFDLFENHRSIYASALLDMAGRGILGNITRPTNTSEFATVLRNFGQFDLLVYSSQFTQAAQPYDAQLTDVLCSRRIKSIVSDNRRTSSAASILACAGAKRGPGANFTAVLPTNSSLLSEPSKLRHPDDIWDTSYELLPADAKSSTQATFETGSIAVLASGNRGINQEYFITVLNRGPAKLKPVKYWNNTYTLEDLHPTFRIPSTHWPSCGYDSINATVTITRPLASLSGLIVSASVLNSTILQGDFLGPRGTAAQSLGAKQNISTETRIFSLFDDGTNGDTTANDRYWETSLPGEFTAFDGDYHLHARFRLCSKSTCGKETCIEREAQQTITVVAKMSPSSKYTTERLPQRGNRLRMSIRITPADEKGTLLGPGFADQLLVTRRGDVVVEHVVDWDGKGTYEILADYSLRERAAVVVGQYGRPKNAVTIAL
ncbi:hypothetical protein B0T10DRAFT_467770 [Thelonectria olida]|uniref:VWFA domain-containing protein n=1 Tax=Thelonectria olida TaxID=1576542 RepID=A0A9P9ADY2_9HYPO|nr:hypothetical protein B0T10DRAFT_467770 [Thelonectria olida]